MEKPANIYPVIVYDLKKKMKAFVDKLNDEGQIDLDDNGYPYIIKIDRSGNNNILYILRNNTQETVIINPRSKRDPVVSWNYNDGFKRTGGKKLVTYKSEKGTGGERRKRNVGFFESLIDTMLR